MVMAHIFIRFLHCNKGSSAVEFAMVVPMFLAVVFSIFEVAYVFMTDLALETALNDAARLIRTGQASGGTISKDQFKDIVCDGTFGIINCSDVNIEVNVFDDFQAATQLPDLTDDDDMLNNNQVFNSGDGGSIIVIRATYVYDIINPFGEITQLANYGDNQFLQVHIVAFKNEPF